MFCAFHRSFAVLKNVNRSMLIPTHEPRFALPYLPPPQCLIGRTYKLPELSSGSNLIPYADLDIKALLVYNLPMSLVEASNIEDWIKSIDPEEPVPGLLPFRDLGILTPPALNSTAMSDIASQIGIPSSPILQLVNETDLPAFFGIPPSYNPDGYFSFSPALKNYLGIPFTFNTSENGGLTIAMTFRFGLVARPLGGEILLDCGVGELPYGQGRACSGLFSPV